MRNIRHTIAVNLRKLIDAEVDSRGHLTTARAVARTAKVSKNTVLRLLSPEPTTHLPLLTNVEAVARAFHLEVFQLLAEDFDPKRPPQMMTPAVAEELTRLRLFHRNVLSATTGTHEDDEPDEQQPPRSDGRRHGGRIAGPYTGTGDPPPRKREAVTGKRK